MEFQIFFLLLSQLQQFSIPQKKLVSGRKYARYAMPLKITKRDHTRYFHSVKFQVHLLFIYRFVLYKSFRFFVLARGH